MQAKVVADLRTSRSARDAWLLGIHDRERAEVKGRMAKVNAEARRQREQEQQRHEAMMDLIRHIAPSGHYEYNPVTKRYDRWVPSR